MKSGERGNTENHSLPGKWNWLEPELAGALLMVIDGWLEVHCGLGKELKTLRGPVLFVGFLSGRLPGSHGEDWREILSCFP